MTPPISVAEFRATALELLDYATNGDAGRSESDPVYEEITEHRDAGKSYSSCGDLAHWLLFRLGVRSDYVNRAEHKGWKIGTNISRLAWRCPEARPPKPGDVYQPGDVLIIWNSANGFDAHALVVREHADGVVHSADYGQPGGKRKDRELFIDRQNRPVLGGPKGRIIQKVLPLADVLAGAARRGELAPVDIPPDAEPTRPYATQGVA